MQTGTLPTQGVDTQAIDLGRGRLSNELNHPPLRFRIEFDVPLGCPHIRMASQQLDVADRATDRRYLPCGIGDERPAPAVA